MSGLSNIRLLEDVGPYEKDECIKAVVNQDGTAVPWSGGGLVLYEDEYMLVLSQDTFNKLLRVSPSG